MERRRRRQLAVRRELELGGLPVLCEPRHPQHGGKRAASVDSGGGQHQLAAGRRLLPDGRVRLRTAEVRHPAGAVLDRRVDDPVDVTIVLRRTLL